MISLIKKFEIGNTIYFECLYRNIDGFPCDPAEPAWQIRDEADDLVKSGTPSKRKDGIWYFFWIPTQIGNLILIFSGKIEDNAVTIRSKFKIVESRLK